MRIAQVSPLYESVPPKLYGGTERIVSSLTEALCKEGHEVTLFASGDSFCSGRLIPCFHESLRLGGVKEQLAPHFLMFERVRAMAHEFDVIHFHTEYLHFGLIRDWETPVVTTLHGRLDYFEYLELFEEFRETPLISISMNQQKALPLQNWVGNVYHGLPNGVIPFSSLPGGYLAFLGRISPEKGVEDAIEIARRTGQKLKIAAKIDPSDKSYAHSIRSKLELPWVDYVGEISDREKSSFLGNASLLLFPVKWPEPFGLVMIESLSAGTPVVAYNAGSVPEVIRNEETGFVVNSLDEACEAVDKIIYQQTISRRVCRRDFDLRFTSKRMARDYTHIYGRLIRDKRRKKPESPSLVRSAVQLESDWQGGMN